MGDSHNSFQFFFITFTFIFYFFFFDTVLTNNKKDKRRERDGERVDSLRLIIQKNTINICEFEGVEVYERNHGVFYE